MLCSHTVLIKPLSEGTSPRFKKGETCFLTFFSLFFPFPAMGVRKESNLRLKVLEMFISLVTLALVR